MSDENVSENGLSRRRFLFTAAKGGAMIGATTLLASPAAAKVPPTAVNYQPSPKGKARCDSCANWQPPSSCVFVGGAISPAGWCSLYRPKR